MLQSCPNPTTLNVEIVNEIRRSSTGYTEGLQYKDGKLIEGTGGADDSQKTDLSRTVINEINPETGEVRALATPPEKVFGEGIAIHGDKLFQLTYREGKIFVYDYPSMRLSEVRSSPLREGWGLTSLGDELVASDGSNTIYFLDPKDTSIRRTIVVHDSEGHAYESINELERAEDGSVFANIFPTSQIIRFDPASGCVLGKADLSWLAKDRLSSEERARIQSNDWLVLNGIAQHPEKKTFYLTGKYWPKVFEVRFSG